MRSEAELLEALHQYWGYTAFRPLQERIVRSLLQGRDACVVMPTGGGKSLCYQLPAALLSDRTVVVVSPLIALMQDQVAQLTQMGIAAALVNSSLSGDVQSWVLRKAQEGAYRLLYVSPERIARPDTIEWLRRIAISFFAIDEAHCISEWGHEFRPEYRQLSSLRQHFPDRPIAAFTASATRQVRHDIIDQLKLREPDKYIASFHRSNLRYVVKECVGGMQRNRLVTALRKYSGSNVIVYAPTTAKVEETVDFLEEQGISAIPYHGKMDSETRRTNQERWMSDEVRVLVGTIAFGLGINKAAVRAVIHLSLPKSIEQYYQEAGRAGRDGLPADCLLLWQKRDIGLLTYFIEQMEDPAEKERAWKRYHIIRRFVESRKCRHYQICAHFGESPKWKSCGACDICSGELAWLDAPAVSVDVPLELEAIARPSVSRIASARVRPKANRAEIPDSSDPNFELRQYLREWRRKAAKDLGVAAFVIMHDSSLDELCRLRPTSLPQIGQVSGFGEKKTGLYGKKILDALAQFRDGARSAWLDAPDEPKRTKRKRSAAAAMGGDVSRELGALGKPGASRSTSASHPSETERAEMPDTSDPNFELREYLREWRREAAKELGVPAFVVMHDTSLDELCRLRPSSLQQIRQVSGFGERKTALYGQRILEALARFRDGARSVALLEKKPKPAEETLRLLAEGRTFEEIAKVRGRQLSTVISMVADFVEKGELEFQADWIEAGKQAQIAEAGARLGLERLKSLKEALPPDFTFDEIKLVVARLRQEKAKI